MSLLPFLIFSFSVFLAKMPCRKKIMRNSGAKSKETDLRSQVLVGALHMRQDLGGL